MSDYIDERKVLRAISVITEETGYPPDALEVAAALGCSTKQVHSALLGAKRRGLVRYTDADRFEIQDDPA